MKILNLNSLGFPTSFCKNHQIWYNRQIGCFF